MRIKNKTKRLIVLNYMNGKARKALSLGAGVTVENEHLSETDVAFYVKNGSIEKIEVKEAALNPVVLPAEPNKENLKDYSVADLKRWCKENGKKKYSAFKEDELIAFILAELKPQE